MWISVLALMVFANLYDGVKSSPLPPTGEVYRNTSDISHPDVHSLPMLISEEVIVEVGDGARPTGSHIRMVCNVDEFPTPGVLWYKDDNLLQPNDRIRISGFELMIVGAEKNDAGKYRCGADTAATIRQRRNTAISISVSGGGGTAIAISV